MKLGLGNKTNKEIITLYHHPILYFIGIYALLLVIIGTIGNLLTIIILLRPNLRRHTTMRYLVALATADLCALYSWNLNLVYKHLINPYQNDLEDSSVVSCRLISFVAFRQFTAFLVVSDLGQSRSMLEHPFSSLASRDGSSQPSRCDYFRRGGDDHFF